MFLAKEMGGFQLLSAGVFEGRSLKKPALKPSVK